MGQAQQAAFPRWVSVPHLCLLNRHSQMWSKDKTLMS